VSEIVTAQALQLQLTLLSLPESASAVQTTSPPGRALQHADQVITVYRQIDTDL